MTAQRRHPLEAVAMSLGHVKAELEACKASITEEGNYETVDCFCYIGDALDNIDAALIDLKSLGITPTPQPPVRLLAAVEAWRESVSNYDG